MARIRTIKPEFFTSEDIVSLSAMARLLYIALWCEADKEGRLSWKPRTFKMRYLPGDDCSVEDLCEEIIEAGLVELYGNGLAFIPSFKNHQHINPRESESVLPDPHEFEENTTRAPRVTDASLTHREEGREGKESKTRRVASVDEVGFATFWHAFPNKKAKADALKAWSKLKPDDLLQASILKAIESQRQGEEWRKEGGRFIPHPATWINGRRWEDATEGSPMGPNGRKAIFAGAI